MHWPSGFVRQKKKKEHSGNAKAAASHAKLYGFVELIHVFVSLFFVLHFHHKFFVQLCSIVLSFVLTASSTVGQECQLIQVSVLKTFSLARITKLIGGKVQFAALSNGMSCVLMENQGKA